MSRYREPDIITPVYLIMEKLLSAAKSALEEKGGAPEGMNGCFAYFFTAIVVLLYKYLFCDIDRRSQWNMGRFI